jgi:hypothetical protein
LLLISTRPSAPRFGILPQYRFLLPGPTVATKTAVVPARRRIGHQCQRIPRAASRNTVE